MTTYKLRLDTFKYSPTRWPHTPPTPQPKDLAAAGFKFVPTKRCPDQVECTECLLRLDGWKPTDNAASEHVRRMPGCMTALQEHNQIKENVQSFNKRIATFTSWPRSSPHPKYLAAAGFVYAPSKNCPDRVQCMECLQYLGNWKPEDDPLLEHIRWQPDCKLAGNLTDKNQQRIPSEPISLARKMGQPVAQPTPISKSQPAIAAQSGAQNAWQKESQQGLSKQHEQQSGLQLRERKASKQDQQPEKVSPQMTAQDPKREERDKCVSANAEMTPIPMPTSSTSPNEGSTPISPFATPATPAVAEVSISSRPDTLPPASLTPPDQPMSESSCDTKTETTLAKTQTPASRESTNKAVLDVGDWVEIEFEAEEEDDWVQV